MSYTVTESKETKETAIEAGDYLVTLERSVERESQAGNKYLSLMFRINEGQKYAKKCLFKAIFKDDNGQYKFSFLNSMLTSIGIKDKEYNTITDALKDLDGKEFLAVVKVDDKDETRNYISFFKKIEPAEDTNDNDFEITDDDLPF